MLAPAPTPTPTKPGWHLVHFGNGQAGIVRWDPSSGWAWGGVKPPRSPVVSFDYLGADVPSVATTSAGLARWGRAIATLPAHLASEAVTAIDVGPFGLHGQPVLLSGAQSDFAPGSSAVPTNIIPSPIDPNVGNSHLSVPSLTGLFGNLGFWKGIGLVLAGAAILIFAALELRKL